VDKLINDIKNILSSPPKNHEIQYIHKNLNIRKTFDLYENNSQNLFHLYYNINGTPKCNCGKDLKFISFNKGYRQYCSSRCQMIDKNFQNKMKEYYLKKYNVENPAQSKDIINKTKSTNLEKYGVEYYLELQNAHNRFKEIKLEKYGNENYNNINKIKSTNLKKYGVEWISQNKEISDKQQLTKKNNNSFYNKIKNKYNDIKPLFSKESYLGVGYNNKYLWKCNICKIGFKDDLYAGRAPRCPICNPKLGGISKQEKKIVNYCKSLNIQIIENSRSIISPYEIDIYFPDYKLGIEYNGLYWHSVEKIKDKYYHQNKVKLANNKDIRLLHIWEHEWEENKELIQDNIEYYMNNLQEEILPKEPELHNIHDNLIWI